MAISREIGQRLTATVPRILATILNGTIAAGMVVLFHRCRATRLIPCRALTHFAREEYFLAPVYDRFTDGFCDCGHADRRSSRREKVMQHASMRNHGLNGVGVAGWFL
jgi:hypothetical protein